MTEKSTLPWQNAVIAPNATIQDVIRNLDQTGFQISLVVGTDGVLQGTITDGDIRRSILQHMTLDSAITSIIHRNPFVVRPQIPRDMVIHLMQANRIHQMPVIDDGGRVVGLHLWDKLSKNETRSNIMVIMAGGKGVRLRPHTENCPKPMVLVSGKPMLEHIIEQAKSEGFREFVISIHYLGHMIQEHFGDGSAWDVRISYLEEVKPLGTAGALSLFSKRPEAPFLVTNGDVLTDIRYGELLDFHLRNGAYTTMAVRRHEWQNPYGVVLTRGVEVIGFEEKPVVISHVNAGIYALSPEALDVLNAGDPCDMPTLFQRLQDAGKRTVVYPMHEPWLDVGRPEDLLKANAFKENRNEEICGEKK